MAEQVGPSMFDPKDPCAKHLGARDFCFSNWRTGFEKQTTELSSSPKTGIRMIWVPLKPPGIPEICAEDALKQSGLTRASHSEQVWKQSASYRRILEFS